MGNSRLYELLHTFSAAEYTAFGKYLRSPYFNHREDILRLFEYYFEKKEARRAGVFDKEKVFAAVFPAEPFDEKKLNYVISFLYQAAQHFLVFNDPALENEAELKRRLAKILRARGLAHQSETALKKAEEALAAGPYRDLRYHRQAHLLYLERFESEARQRRSAVRSFQEMIEESDIHFVAEKLRQGCSAHMYQAVAEAHFHIELLPEALALVERRQWQTLPAVGVYYYAWRALTEADSQTWFEQLREAMHLHLRYFSQAEMRDVYTLAVNYCIRQINTRQGEGLQAFYLRQVFDIYQKGIENELFTENGVLSRFTYKNIANAGLGLKAFDWVEGFLKKYKGALDPKHRESAYVYNLANLHFRRSDYGAVLTLLTQTEFDDVLHQLDARRMILRSYYELGEFSALDSLLDSFQTFLRRRRDVGYLRQNYLNLIRLTKKLLQLPAADSAARHRLRAEVEGAKVLAEREWLLGKLD
ncbi:MAG: hypothetical protein KF852_13335 [Saprospiraceae bacterium]|nr:hypothetical protein [Saprospiraceae bacterium]